MFSKRKLAAIVYSCIVAVGFTVGGSTYAIFKSSATNANKSFTAGTVILDQNRNHGDNSTIKGPMFYSQYSDTTGRFPDDKETDSEFGGEAIGGWAPGDHAIRAMNIYNKGSLEVRINKLKANVNTAGVTSGDAYNEFIDKMNIKVIYLNKDKPLYDGKLSGLLNDYVDIKQTIIAMPKSDPVNITFIATLSKDAGETETGKKIQGQNFVFDFTFSAEQTESN